MLRLKICYAQEIQSWLRTNPIREEAHYQTAGFLSKAYLKAAAVDIAVNGFRRTGFFHCDRYIFH
jgi:hypothetical protein